MAVSAAPADDVSVEAKQTILDEEFQKTLSGATLIGHYTLGELTEKKQLSEDKYTISKVIRLPDQPDRWRFFVRIQYGEIDLDIPLELDVKWAGDTPVISLTDYKIPVLGTFSARVVIHGGQYAGTWNHGDVRGHLFGKITKANSSPDEGRLDTRDDKTKPRKKKLPSVPLIGSDDISDKPTDR